MKVVYLITDRYEHAEFFEFYGKGLYETLEEAKADFKNALYSFLSYGPDDCHDFKLTKNEVSDTDYDILKSFISEYEAGSLDHNAGHFTNEMERILNSSNCEIIYQENDDANFEIVELAEEDGHTQEELIDSPELYSVYFDKYFNKHYKI